MQNIIEENKRLMDELHRIIGIADVHRGALIDDAKTVNALLRQTLADVAYESARALVSVGQERYAYHTYGKNRKVRFCHENTKWFEIFTASFKQHVISGNITEEDGKWFGDIFIDGRHEGAIAFENRGKSFLSAVMRRCVLAVASKIGKKSRMRENKRERDVLNDMPY